MALFDIWGGVKAGNDLFNNSIAQMGKFAADRALREKYGVTAGDPDLAAKLETNAFNLQNNPLVLQNNTLANTARQQTIDFNTQNNPLVLQNNELANVAKQQSNAFNLQNDPLRIQQQQLTNQGSALANTEAGIKNQAGQVALDNALQANRAQQAQSVLGTVLPALQTRLTGETDPVARMNIFNDAVRQVAPVLGMTPDQAVQAAAGDAQLVAEKGADAIPELTARLGAARFSSLTPTQGATLAKTQAEARAAEAKVGQAQAAAEASKASAALSVAKTGKEHQDAQAGSLKLVDDARNARSHASAIDAPLQRVLQLNTSFTASDGTRVPSEMERALAAIDALPDNTILRTAQSYVPGTAAYVAQQYVKTIKDQLGLADIQAMRNAGTTLGRTTNMELEAASNAYATLDTTGLSKEALRTAVVRMGEQAIPAFAGSLREAQQGYLKQADTIEAVLRERGFAPGGIQPGSAQPGAAPAAPAAQPNQTPAGVQQLGASPQFFSSVAQAESGADGIKAANPRSTAVGTYQFTLPTWGALMKQHPSAGLTPTGRTDPAQQQVAMTLLTQDNAAVLRDNNIPVNDGTLYAAHFTGGPTAVRLYQTPLTTPLSAALGSSSKAVLRANPALKGMTVGDFWAFVDGKMRVPLQTATAGGITPAGAAPQPAAPARQFVAPPSAAMTQGGFIAPATSLADAGRILGLQ